MSQDFIPDTAGRRAFRQRGFVLLLLLCSAVVIFFVVLMQKRSPVVTVPQAIPLPFGSVTDGRDRRGSVTTSPLKGLVTDLGTTTDNRTIVDMTFDNDEISESFGMNELTFVITPEEPNTFSAGAPLSVALPSDKRLFGYKYTSRDATEEIDKQLQRKNDTTGRPFFYPELFPGEFFASEADLADEGSAPRQFQRDHDNVTFKRLSEVTLDPDSRYLIITEEDGVSIIVRGLVWCGDGFVRSPEICDDENRSDHDGCSVTCVVETGWICTPSILSDPTSQSLCIPEIPVCGNGVEEHLALLGDDVMVNDPALLSRYGADIASDGRGNALIVWLNRGNAFPTDRDGIYGRRMSATGMMDSEIIRFDADTRKQLSWPRIALNDDGNGILVWQEEKNIQVRRISQWGGEAASAFTVNQHALNASSGVYGLNDVAVDAAGNAVVVWEDVVLTGGKYVSLVFGRVLHADGSPSDEFRIDASNDLAQFSASAAMNDNGQIVVGWTDFRCYADDKACVFARWFDRNGTALTQPVRIDQRDNISYGLGGVDMYENGDSVIVWQSSLSGIPGIYMRQCSAAGVCGVVARVDVLGYSTDNPAVSLSEEHGGMVAWSEYNHTHRADDLQVRAFDREGAFTGKPFIADQDTGTMMNKYMRIAIAKHGVASVTWFTPTASSANGTVYVRRLSFETCDDRNVVSGDGCSALCQLDEDI